jgi:halocyanin-like protein
MTREKRRRTFLRAALVATAGGLAGCSNNGSGTEEAEEEEEEEAEEEEEETATGTATGTAAGTDEPEPTPTEDAPEPTEMETETPVPEEEVERVQDFDTAQRRSGNWFQDTTNYNGDYVDLRNEAPVQVRVGTPANSGNFGFDPVAVRIEAGTTVEWQWTGQGGSHNVVDQQGTFRSGAPESGGGISFRHTFDETGWYRYKCTNHETFGMVGAVFVDPERTLSGYTEVDDWLEDYQYDGTLTDRRNQGSVDVTVGASGNSGPFAFRPIAILVSPGTEINFDWTGRGGVHDVTWEQGDLEDSRGTGSATGSYSVTIDDPGVYLYKCQSHQPTGGRGAIVVDDG